MVMTTEKVAVVTGAGSGLGRLITIALADHGWYVVAAGRRFELLEDTVGLALPEMVLPVRADVADEESVAALFAAVRDRFGRLDLLVNNAGTLGVSPLPALADYPVSELRTAFEVNVIAPVALTQLLLPLLRASGGAVLNITSDAAVEAYAGWGGYGAAKAALEQASNVLAAEELAVRVWWADPGDLRTDMHQQAFPGEDISDRPWPETIVPAFTRLVAERLPSGRYRAAHLLPAAR